jgi:hypothetical protein
MRKKIMSNHTYFNSHLLVNAFRSLDSDLLSRVRLALNTGTIDTVNVIIAELEKKGADEVKNIIVAYRKTYLNPVYQSSGGDSSQLKLNNKNVREVLVLICDQCSRELDFSSKLAEKGSLLDPLITKV